MIFTCYIRNGNFVYSKFTQQDNHYNSLALSSAEALKEYEIEGIEIALEGIWYEDNRWKSARGRGEGKEKIAEASARFMSISVTNWRYL